MPESARPRGPESKPQIRPWLIISERDGRRLSEETGHSRSTIQRWAHGRESMNDSTVRSLELARRKLGIPRVVKIAKGEEIEAAPVSNTG
jgi:hypothetical protein